MKLMSYWESYFSPPAHTAIPCSTSRSSLGWGRSGSLKQCINRSGADGSLSRWGMPPYALQVFVTSSSVGLISNDAYTAARCPLLTGTRAHLAENRGVSDGTIIPFSILPHIFWGSVSLFSSSPLIYGIISVSYTHLTLPTIA